MLIYISVLKHVQTTVYLISDPQSQTPVTRNVSTTKLRRHSHERNKFDQILKQVNT